MTGLVSAFGVPPWTLASLIHPGRNRANVLHRPDDAFGHAPHRRPGQLHPAFQQLGGEEGEIREGLRKLRSQLLACGLQVQTIVLLLEEVSVILERRERGAGGDRQAVRKGLGEGLRNSCIYIYRAGRQSTFVFQDSLMRFLDTLAGGEVAATQKSRRAEARI